MSADPIMGGDDAVRDSKARAKGPPGVRERPQMTAVNALGVRVEVNRSAGATPGLSGNDSELRGLWAKHLLRSGFKVPYIKRLIKVSRAQLYRDLDAADALVARTARGRSRAEAG